MKTKLKEMKGFTTVDLTLAMIVIMIFVTIFASFTYNIYLSSTEAKRTAAALNYAVDIFEHIGELDFSEVTGDNSRIFSVESIKGLKKKTSSATKAEATVGTYEIKLDISNYNSSNRMKVINLTITYPVSNNKTEKIEFSRLKVDEA